MRIAFFGGSFDPPHRGHVAIATAAADRLALDRVLVAPVGRQPLKNGLSMAPYADRLAMVKLAFSQDTRFEASTLDAPRPDGQHNYTYETLSQLKRSLPASSDLFCLLGADSFHTVAHWHLAEKLMLLCDFIIAARPGYPLQQVGSQLPDGMRVRDEVEMPGLVEVHLQSVANPDAVSSLYVLTEPEEDISATALRQALASEETATSDRMLAPTVADYICAHRLYSAC
jgi:nicotinate-nucleotide adenylyltransferase